MSRIKGFRPPPETLPPEAMAARLMLENVRMRNALVRVIDAARRGAELTVVLELAQDGLRRPMV